MDAEDATRTAALIRHFEAAVRVAYGLGPDADDVDVAARMKELPAETIAKLAPIIGGLVQASVQLEILDELREHRGILERTRR